MRILKIPFPNIAFYEKSRIITPDPKILEIEDGASSIYVRNTAGLAANDFIILDAFESEDAEIVKIKSIERESHLLDLYDQTYQAHSIGAVVMKTPWNKIKIYSGTTSDISNHVEIVGAEIDLRPDNAYTTYYHEAGEVTTYYSYKYMNNAKVPTVYGTQTLYTENDYDAVLTVSHLKDWFMFGLDLTDDDGLPFPNSMFEFAIRAAVDSLEKTLMVKLKPTQIIGEKQDYFRQDYLDFAFIQLNEYPVVSVEKVSIKYPTAAAEITFPIEWIQLHKSHGQIHLIPTSGSLSNILMGKGGDYLTFVWRGFDWMPQLWRIDYTAGFEAGATPSDLIGVVGKMACFYPLNIAGDLVGGIAIASKSIGIDGLSQSINTTSSAENAGYSARLRQYERELKIEIPRLVAFYKGLRFTCA